MPRVRGSDPGQIQPEPPPAYIRHMARLPLPLLTALMLLVGGTTSAQDRGKPNKVVLYKDRLAAQWDTVNCVKNVFKLNPLLFLRGEAPLYYERALSPKISAEVAVGVTFRNYLGGDLTDSPGQRIAVLRDMLELGPDAAALHGALKDAVEQAGVDILYACGPLMRTLYEGTDARRRGNWAAKAADLKPILAADLKAGDVVVVKASNGTKLGGLVEGLKAEFGKGRGVG